MKEFLNGLIFLLAFGYLLFALGWIYVAWTEYLFSKEMQSLKEKNK